MKHHFDLEIRNHENIFQIQTLTLDWIIKIDTSNLQINEKLTTNVNALLESDLHQLQNVNNCCIARKINVNRVKNWNTSKVLTFWNYTTLTVLIFLKKQQNVMFPFQM